MRPAAVARRGLSTPPPPPPVSRTDYTAYTRKTRAFEPDAPELTGKRIDRARLGELERIPAEVRDIHRALLRLLPEQVFGPGFVRSVRETVQRYTESDLDMWLDSVRVVPRTQLRALIPGASLLAVIGLEPLAEKVIVELDLRFVYLVVDKLLGGRGAAVDVHRPPTDIEQGVFSFLLLKVLALFQTEIEQAEPVAVRLEDMRSDLRACADLLRREDHWLVAAWKMNVDLDVSFVRALVPVSLARRVGTRSLPEGSALLGRHHERVRSRIGRLQGLRFSGRVEAGRIEFRRDEVRGLDPGDIVVFEAEGLGLDEDGAPAGAAVLRFGGGHSGAIHGVAGPMDGRRVFQIERIEAFTVPRAHDPRDMHGAEGHPEEVMAEYEHHPDHEEADRDPAAPQEVLDEDYGLDDEDAGGGEGYDAYDEYAEGEEGYEVEGEAEANGDNLAEVEPLLSDLPVPVVVELGRVELSADEVICLRPGQLLELGRSPTDPVDLVVNGRLLAKGELVEIEGQLGVRISSLAKESPS